MATTTDWAWKVPAVVSTRKRLSSGDGEDAVAEEDGDVGFGALALEHGDDVVGGAVAEELAEGLLVVGDAVLFDEGDDVGGV